MFETGEGRGIGLSWAALRVPHGRILLGECMVFIFTQSAILIDLLKSDQALIQSNAAGDGSFIILNNTDLIKSFRSRVNGSEF